jgi:hypothetical protein
LTALIIAPLSAGQLAPISAACSGADAVVAGKLHRSAGAAIANVAVSQVIKGQDLTNTILPVQLLSRSSSPFGSDEELTAIVFLKQDGSGWELIPFAGDNAPLMSLTLPAQNDGAAGQSMQAACEDQVLALALPALNDGNIAWYRLQTLGWFHGYDSAAYRGRLATLSQAADPEFRAMGIEGRLPLGDVSALQQLEADAAALGPATLAEVGLVLGAWRNPDGAGIAELGKIVGLSGARYAPLAQGAAQSLHALHTLDSLPILYRLLDSPDPTIRLEAMFGFAAFVANFPIQSPENEPSNRNITPLPGGEYSTGDGASHFPSAGSDNQETLAFWKAWYQANFVNSH